MRNTIIALISASAILPSTGQAEQLTKQECADLGSTMQILAEQNLAISEIRKDITVKAMEALVQNDAQGYYDKALLDSVSEMLDDVAIDAKDLVPGIRVFRKYCRD